MEFILLPILDKMEAFYQLPRNNKRFETYLFMLQGKDKVDLILPIAGYNPMGDENVLLKIQALKELEAEKLIQKMLAELNPQFEGDRKIAIAINLADDIGGAWSNNATTDFDSKFKISALVKRGFCTPYFFTSETLSKAMIIQRSKEYVYRTIFCIENGNPSTLADYLKQEVYVQQHSKNNQAILEATAFANIEKHYQENASSTDYNLIFNFFYGDEASLLFEFTKFGIGEITGFEFAKYIAAKK